MTTICLTLLPVDEVTEEIISEEIIHEEKIIQNEELEESEEIETIPIPNVTIEVAVEEPTYKKIPSAREGFLSFFPS